MHTKIIIIGHEILKAEIRPPKWEHPPEKHFGPLVFKIQPAGFVFHGKFKSGITSQYKVNTLFHPFESEWLTIHLSIQRVKFIF